MADPVLLLRVGRDLAERQRDLVERDPRAPRTLAGLDDLFQAPERGRMPDLEAADLGAPQRGEMAAHPERRAQVVRQAARVGAGGAGQAEADAAVLELP